MTIIEQECPGCGGPPVPPVPYTDVRRCERGIALVVGGRTVAHLSAWEALTNAGSLTLLAAKDGVFLLDGHPGGDPAPRAQEASAA